MHESSWTHWQFFHRGDAFFEAVVRRIREARHSIQIETYIFETDALTEGLLQELGEARKRGCRVQLLVDGIGSFYWLESLRERCRKLDLELRVWQPVPRTFSSVRHLLRTQGFRLLRVLRQLNRRNHRKIVLVDREIAFLGSQNWTQVHSESFMGENAWRDSGLEVRGPALKDLERAMSLAWRRSATRRPAVLQFRSLRDSKYNALLSAVRLNQDRRNRRRIAVDLLRRIRRAQKHILIESAYFLPTRRQFIALRKAARRGVRVEVVLPGRSDVPMVKWAADGLSKVLIRSGAKLFEYQPRILHAKFYVIDDWASIGSTNFNHRSFFHDLEVEAVFQEPGAVQDLLTQWHQDREQSLPMSPLNKNSTVFWKRWLFQLAFRLRYLL